MYQVTVRFCGNPDRDQYADVLEPRTFRDKSMDDLSRQVRTFLREQGIGAGNFAPGPVRYRGKPWATLYYNGRWERITAAS